MLDFGFTKYLGVAAASVLHDYAVEVARAYPEQILGYERLTADWKALGYSEEVLDRVFYRNGEQFLN